MSDDPITSRHGIEWADAINGLDKLAITLESVRDVLTDEEIYALSAARTILGHLQKLSIAEWSSYMTTSDGTPIAGTECQHTGLCFQDSLTCGELQQLIREGLVETDPRVIVTTPQKAHAFLEGFGLRPKLPSVKGGDTYGSNESPGY